MVRGCLWSLWLPFVPLVSFDLQVGEAQDQEGQGGQGSWIKSDDSNDRSIELTRVSELSNPSETRWVATPYGSPVMSPHPNTKPSTAQITCSAASLLRICPKVL